MNNLKRRAAALLLALCLLAGLAVSPASGEEAEITISSVEDLLAFAKNCTLDTWSQGKTVRLTADLDLSEIEFIPIPTFGGTFLGEGHSLTNLHITAAGSNIGLFRYLQEGAVVQGLHVTGTVRPSGSAVNVGGLVGSSAGAIRNCTFHGFVEGKSAVGGVVGLNQETGEAARCIVSGTVTGEAATGGVAGRNLGGLLQCESMVSVNTNTPDMAGGSMDVEALILPLESAAVPSDDDGGGFLKSHSDTGGIAGYSSGVIYSCLNSGTIGYPHVGYNVGGIAGRQNGHLYRCTNRGQVYGRKDVGGIVGQAEPDVALSPDSGTLDRLRRELDTLEALINRALDRADGSADSISARLSGIGLSTDAARDHTKALLDQLDQFTGENITSLNSLSATATKALGDLTPALEELSEVSERVETLANRLETALDALGSAAEDGEGVSADASHAAGVFRRAGELLSAAVRDLRAAVDALQSAVVVQDPAAVEAGLADLSAALEAFGSAMEQAGQAAEALRGVLESFPALDGLGDILKEQLAPSLASMGAALRQAGSALKAITGSTSLDWSQVRASLREAGAGFQNLGSASERLNDAIAALQTALDSLGGLSGRLGSAVKELADAAALAAPVGRGLARAFDILGSVAQGLAEDGPIQLTPLSEAARESSRGLFSSLADLSQEMKDLNSAISSAGDSLSTDLRAISRQFNTVFSVLLDALADLQNGTDSTEFLEDTSDENIAATLLGKVEGCQNEAPVDGDRNVGGIVGTMSIEYDIDPEGDLELSLGSTYETKAVLQNSVNHGAVTSKKDCAGGLVGRMDLGTALGCENYGPVTSTSGSFVGGVAGYAGAVVRESFARCALSGSNDIGGIAGWAGQVRNCYAIATVLEGTERIGAIAGSGELENLRNNFFIDTGTAGIDGVSYAGSAQPIAFDALRQLPDIPEEFAAFTLTLTADGKTVQEIPFTYGQDLSQVELPPVPELEGSYGEWPAFDTSGLNSDILLEAVYKPWVTLVASQEQEGNLALALAEGRFTEEAVLHASINLSSTAESSAVWEITLTGTDLGQSDEVPLRLLNTLDGRAEVLGYQDSQWVPLHAKTNGSYLLVTMTGTVGSFQIVPAQSSGLLSTLLLLAAALFALLVAFQIRKRKKAAKEPAKT